MPARMAWHCRNARAVAEFLAQHPRVETVYWPGLPSHPNHAVAARQMRDFGGMLSFRLTGGEATAIDVVTRTRLFTLAESLGGVESLIEHPARMTHASLAGSELEVPGDLVKWTGAIDRQPFVDRYSDDGPASRYADHGYRARRVLDQCRPKCLILAPRAAVPLVASSSSSGQYLDHADSNCVRK